MRSKMPSISLDFKWDTAGGGNKDFRVGLPVSPYVLASGDQIILGPNFISAVLPASSVTESGTGTVNSDIGEGWCTIEYNGYVKTYGLVSGNYFTSGAKKVVELRFDRVINGGLITITA